MTAAIHGHLTRIQAQTSSSEDASPLLNHEWTPMHTNYENIRVYWCPFVVPFDRRLSAKAK
jgi:hypothetical protein